MSAGTGKAAAASQAALRGLRASRPAAHAFGLSTQDTAYQAEAAQRLHLPFPLLSDARGALTRVLRLPKFEVEGMVLLRRLTLVIDDGRITRVFYPVFPPNQNASAVVSWLSAP